MQPKLTSLSKVGDTYKGFEVTKSMPIPELQCHLRELLHVASGAQIMHIANDDVENVFCLSFRTYPDSSNGAAHILEHTVLCGSEKFPVKDPFFAMQRRSLNTFMNALTGQDFTCYPAATQVPQDFYNLLDVYLDAVFHPILNRYSFLQEGHRLEFALPDNPESPLEYKGIVFNEMKGAMSSPSARMGELINKHLYPDITYGYNSGGDPKAIPNLTYEELIAFHEKYYHPSRCVFFFYGNLPLEKHLDFILEKTLKNTNEVPQLPNIPLQPRFLKPREVLEHYPISPDDDLNDKTLIGFGWLTCHVWDQETLLALSILRIILLGTDASPVRMALLRSGLCKEISSYIDSDISEPAFVIVARGCNPENAESLETCLTDSLKKIVEEGIALEPIESAIHQLEIAKSEITSDHNPFGLSLFMRSALIKQHGGKAEEGLVIHALFDKILKKVLENPRYFVDLIVTYFLDNAHYVRAVLSPDKEMAAKELAEEKATLDRLHSHLSKKQIEQILSDTKELAEFQKKQEEEDQDCLPTVSIKDVSRAPRLYSLKEETSGILKVFHHDCFTNGITYTDLVFDLPQLTEEELPYVSLMSMLMSQMGCGGRTYKENLEYIIAHTGGVGASLTLNLQAQDHSLFHPSFNIRGKALHRNVPKLLALIQDMATSMDFTDTLRLREVVYKYFTGLESNLNQNAIRYAINLSASGLDVPSKISNDWYGLKQFLMIRNLAHNFDLEAPKLIAKLQELKEKILCIGTPHLVISCDAETYDTMRGHHFYGLDQLPCKATKPWTSNYSLEPIPPQGRIISSPIAFTGKVFKTASYVHPDTPALNVAAVLCDNLTLHKMIREQGGAYGSGAVSNSMAGNFYLYSYRDPNIVSTLKAFDECIRSLSKGEFDEEDIEQAKLELLQGMDSPVSPGSRADVAYGWMREGKSYEVRQKNRERLLDLQGDQVIDAVKKILLPNMETGAPVAFAGKDLLEKENAALVQLGLAPLKIMPI